MFLRDVSQTLAYGLAYLHIYLLRIRNLQRIHELNECQVATKSAIVTIFQYQETFFSFKYVAVCGKQI